MFNRLRGNARGCLIYEPLFLIPYNVFVPYVSVYMLELGISERNVGWITSFGLVLQIFPSVISGYLTDRMGRKKALLTFDLISWSVATLLWACAQNIGFFIAAAVFNGFQRVPNTAWYCLLVEDTEPEERPHLFTVLQVIGVLGGLCAPLGGWLVHQMTLVPAVRVMYGVACISMTIMFLGRNAATHETEIGLRKKKEFQAMHVKAMARDYAAVLKAVLVNKPLLVIFGIYILFQFQGTLSNTYLSIYLVRHLHFAEASIAVFPAITSIATLLFMYGVSPRLNKDRLAFYMTAGFLISAAACLLIIVSPPRAFAPIIISTLLTAIGSILTYPYLETAVANTIGDEQRAGMLSVLSVLILGFVSPAGAIGGWSYGIDPRLPILLIMLAFLGCTLLMIVYRYLAKLSKNARL